jgi:hypothetical protein
MALACFGLSVIGRGSSIKLIEEGFTGGVVIIGGILASDFGVKVIGFESGVVIVVTIGVVTLLIEDLADPISTLLL